MDFDILDPDLWATGDPGRHGVPYEQLARLRNESPCLRHENTAPGLVPWSWIVTRYQDVIDISRDAQRFISGQGITLWSYDALGAGEESKPNMLAMDGDRHSRNRRVIGSGFSPKVMRAFQGRLDAICEQAVDKAVTEIGRASCRERV